MKSLSCSFFVIVLFVFHTTCTLALAEPAGMIKTVFGQVSITNGQTTKTAIPNMRFEQGDCIKTGKNSSVGLLFEDDTVVSLGANAELVVVHFLFNPLDKQLSFVARMVKGTFSLITGQIAKLAPKNVKLQTPNATLGVRGTKILVKIE